MKAVKVLLAASLLAAISGCAKRQPPRPAENPATPASAPAPRDGQRSDVIRDDLDPRP